MYIPKKDLSGFATDLRDRCMATTQERSAFYDLMRKYYLFGSDTTLSDYNKVLTHIDTVSAFIFAPGGTRLTVEVPTMKGAPGEVMEAMADRAAQEMNLQWHSDGHDMFTMNTVTWALVYGVMFEKDLWVNRPDGPGIVAYQVTPYNLGVLNENLTDIKQQQALCHQFFFDADELWSILKLLPDAEAIWNRITFQETAESIPTMNTLQTVITSSQAQGPTLSGFSAPQTGLPSGMFRPVINSPVARAWEIWAWDDMQDDYAIITLIEPDVILFGKARPNFYLPRTKTAGAKHPFTKFEPWPLEGYFWGMSEVYPVMKLQGWSDEVIGDIRKLQKLRIKPPLALSGFNGISDEKESTLWDAGSFIQSDIPGAKIERMVPDMPADVFQEPDKIDGYFADMSGMKSILRGEGVQGLRGEGHAALLSKFAGARVNKKALAIEQGLVDSVSLKLRLLRRFDNSRMLTEAPTSVEFVMDQLSDDAVVKVDAHSHSPVFAGDQLAEATAALKLGAIDKEDWLDLSHLPNKERLKSKARKRDKQKQAMIQQILSGDPKMAESLKRKLVSGAAGGA